MSGRLETLRAELSDFARGFDATPLTPREAMTIVQTAADMARLLEAIKLLAAPKVAASVLWAGNGCRSFEEWLAKVSGTGVGEAIATAETAQRLEDLPATEQALREGKLSRIQVQEVASAATADPVSEGRLLHVAETRTVRTLKERAKQVKAAVRDDELARYRRIKRNRVLRTWDDSEGSNLHFRSTADDLAVVKNAIEAYVPAIFDAARQRGEREAAGAYRADALVALAKDATGTTTTETERRLPKAEMRIRIDLPTFRGRPERGEVCEIPGIGPIPVAVARAAMPDAIVDLVVTQGQDVRAIVTHNRTVRRAVQVALEERYPTCAKWDCDATAHLENDHIEDFARTRHTMYDELVRWCPHHHDLRHRGYVPVQLDDGDWDLKPPDTQIVDGRAPPDVDAA